MDVFWGSVWLHEDLPQLQDDMNTETLGGNITTCSTSGTDQYRERTQYGSSVQMSLPYILLVFFSFYSGTLMTTCKSWWIKGLNLLTTSVLFGFPPAQLIGNILLRGQSSIANVGFVGLMSLAWLLYGIHTYSRRYTDHKCVILLYCVTSFVPYFLGYHGNMGKSSLLGSVFENCTIYFSISCHVLYVFASKIPGQKKLRKTKQSKRNLDVVSVNRRQKTDPKIEVSCETEEGKAFYSLLTYSWVWPILSKGFNQNNITAADLFLLPDQLNTKKVQERFYHIIKSRIPCKDTGKTAQDKHTIDQNKRMTLLQALHKAYWVEFYVFVGLFELFSQLIDFCNPITLKLLISHFEIGNESVVNGYLYAFILFLASVGKALVHTGYRHYRDYVLIRVRTAIMTTIYRKVLRISKVCMMKLSTGEVVNLLGTDTDNMIRMCCCVHDYWSIPMEITIAMIVLYRLVGSALLGGLVVVALLVLPVNKLIASKELELEKTLMEQRDCRTKMMNEILNGIKTVKLYTWETHFRTKMEKLRAAELQTLRYRKCLDAIESYLWTVTPVLMTVLTFTLYTMMGNPLSAAKIFTSLAMFMKLLGCFAYLPWLNNTYVDAKISLERIEKFVAITEMDLDNYYTNDKDVEGNEVISINAGEFSWEMEGRLSTRPADEDLESGENTSKSGTLTLREINIDITKGQFIGVIGKVGSGKTSLLNAILAEMRREGGNVAVSHQKDGFALAEQEAWLQHATVRDNILFGKPFEARKYAMVLDAASLVADLRTLPAGDKTEIGENGVTLSGGQRIRVALARALYQDKDVYLLDDPLAAVDAHVAQHIYDKCIMGLLKTKTRILCTHHTKFLGNADLVIVMEDGVISTAGSPSDVLPNTTYVEQYIHDENTPMENFEIDVKESDGKLVEDESTQKGEVKLQVYKVYFTAFGKLLASVLFFCIIIMHVFATSKDWWLTHWVSGSHTFRSTLPVTDWVCPAENIFAQISYVPPTPPEARPNISGSDRVISSKSVLYYIAVYACLATGCSLFSLIKEILFVFGGLKATKTMHSNFLKALLNAPMSFYDTTPIGKIINRFSSDIGNIDSSMTCMINKVLCQITGLVGNLIISCYSLPWFTIIMVPIAALYYFTLQYYCHTYRELRRIFSVVRSPVYAHFTETLSGLVTIRSFREETRFHDQFIERLEKYQRAYFTMRSVECWLRLRTEMIGVFMMTGITVLAVVQHHFKPVDPALVGLAISYTLTLSRFLREIVDCFTEMEKNMISVERVQQYIDETESEKWNGSASPPSWPTSGIITYKNVDMKYRDGLPNVLNGLNFTTRHAEKIGIIGRTGAGKSSVFQTLFRTVEISHGRILIDGINIGDMDLKDVRRHLAVIPQEPFLFSGTVRENLDPTMSYSDDELWTVLGKCHLRLHVKRLGGIGAEVEERGRNFSLGQRQLVCLTRALLTRTKVLCIDEATASVDLETDTFIQETIRKEFVNSTVLTIAHRINTIMDSDRVLVLDNGQVAELDSPGNLLKNPKSAFYHLVHGRNPKA